MSRQNCESFEICAYKVVDKRTISLTCLCACIISFVAPTLLEVKILVQMMFHFNRHKLQSKGAINEKKNDSRTSTEKSDYDTDRDCKSTQKKVNEMTDMANER